VELKEGKNFVQEYRNRVVNEWKHRLLQIAQKTLTAYVYSISINRVNEEGIINLIGDLTSFLVTIKIDRQIAMGLIFDIFDSKGKSVSVKINNKRK